MQSERIGRYRWAMGGICGRKKEGSGDERRLK